MNADGTLTPEYRLYIIPPEVSDYAHFTPTISNSIYNGGATGCSQIVPGVTTGTFSFDTESKGRFQLICDLNHDTVFDISNDDDLMLIDEMLPGPNSIAWDDRNRSGEPVPFDSYQCQIRAVVGEAHYVSFDVETSFEGMRMYEVAYDHSRTPLPIYWNDTDVQHLAQIMPNGDISPPTSGSYGIYSGSYSDAAVPHGN